MHNAYADLEGYNCFGCSPTNPWGLRCKFVDEGEYVTCHWLPSENFQGFFHILHGGIQATLIDEIASWAIFSHLKSPGSDTVRVRVPSAAPKKVSAQNRKRAQEQFNELLLRLFFPD